jgi:hypothetical protein
LCNFSPTFEEVCALHHCSIPSVLFCPPNIVFSALCTRSSLLQSDSLGTILPHREVPLALHFIYKGMREVKSAFNAWSKAKDNKGRRCGNVVKYVGCPASPTLPRSLSYRVHAVN